MNGLKLSALVALLAGLALLAYAAAEGSLRVGLFLVVPFVYGTGLAATLGMLLVMASALLGFAGLARSTSSPDHQPGMPPPAGERRSATGGVVLLGPIPIVWGNGKVLPWMIATGAALLLLVLVVSWALR